MAALKPRAGVVPEMTVDTAPERGQDASFRTRMWLGVGCVLAATVVGLFAIIGTTVWRVADMTAANATGHASFAFSGMLLMTLTLLRFVAMLIGAGMVFGGLALSFHTNSELTKIGAESESVGKATLATSSPGIAAIVVGAVVILSALFHGGPYQYGETEYWQRADSPPAERPESDASAPIRLPKVEDVLRNIDKERGSK